MAILVVLFAKWVLYLTGCIAGYRIAFFYYYS
jgi:hypothetical protein